jgi:Na+/H+-dicarboxylate symporter
LVGAALGIACNLSFRVPADAANVAAIDANGNGIHDTLEWWAIHVADPLGRVFLRLVLMVVLPLVFSALVLGVLGLGDLSRLGRVGFTSLLYTLILSGTSVAIGIGMVNLIQPGKRLSEEQATQLKQAYSTEAGDKVASAEKTKPLEQILLDMLPENPVQEMAGALDGSSKGNGMLAVMFFALIFGVALSMVEESKRAVTVTLLESLFDASMIIIGFAMRLAPYAVACLMFSMTARMGGGILVTLLWFVLTVVLALSLQMFVVYSLALKVFARRSPAQFFRDSQDAILTAFGTSSSNATLPTALRVSNEKLGIPAEIGRFVNRQPERHGPLRGRRRTVPRPSLWRGTHADAAAYRCLDVGTGRRWDGRGAGRLDSADRRRSSLGRRTAGRGGDHSGRRSGARHVPDDAQCHRRSDARGVRVGDGRASGSEAAVVSSFRTLRARTLCSRLSPHFLLVFNVWEISRRTASGGVSTLSVGTSNTTEKKFQKCDCPR